MNFSIKNILLVSIFFTCSWLLGAETSEKGFATCKFYEKEDCIKVKIVLPERVMAESTLYKINPNSKDVAVRIKNDSLKHLQTFYQLVDIEVYATPSAEEGGVRFKVIEKLERKPTHNKVLKDVHTITTEYFVETDNQVDFRDDVFPKLTVSQDSPHIKYIRFFTKPFLN